MHSLSSGSFIKHLTLQLVTQSTLATSRLPQCYDLTSGNNLVGHFLPHPSSHLKKKIALLQSNEYDNKSLQANLQEAIEENARLSLLSRAFKLNLVVEF